MKKLLLVILVPILATMFVTIEDYESDKQVIESRLELLENEVDTVTYSDCNMMELLNDISSAYEDGFSFIINEDGQIIELKDGIATGDIFTEEDIYSDYCTIEE